MELLKHYCILSFFRFLMCEDEFCRSIIFSDTPYRNDNKACMNSKVCGKAFTVSYIKQYDAYVAGNSNTIRDMLSHCCGDCSTISLTNFTSIKDLAPANNGSSDFIYPVLGRIDTVKKFGYYFVPVFGIESVMYITRPEPPKVLRKIISAYPLLIVCMLFAMVSGFIVWLTETWKNKDEFPRAFPIGWFEGMWYSFVSMTTVGYGDKAPRSIYGKIYAIFWILVGIILCGIISATITSIVLDINSPPPPKMNGKRVGMFKYRDFEGYMIAKLGGQKVEADSVDFHESLLQLVVKLRNKEIDGFVLDTRSFYHISEHLTGFLRYGSRQEIYGNYTKEVEYFMDETLTTEKRYSGLDLYYGILMKNEEDYNYFGTSMRDNQFVIQRRLEEYLVRSYFDKNLTNHHGYYKSSADILFAADGEYFQQTALATLIINASFCFIGILYEMKRRQNLEMAKKDLKTGVPVSEL